MSLRKFAKRGVVATASALLPKASTSNRVVALCYHSIHPDKPFATVTPTMFERHLAWLTEHCDVGAMDEGAIHGRPTENGRPRVLLTFDDGYDDNYDIALPLLQKHGVSATFYVTTGLIQRDPVAMARYARDRNCGEDLLGSLTWSQLREMRSAGMVIGAHGHTHLNLADADEETARRELSLSRQLLEDELGQPVRSMAYPYGKPEVHFTRRGTVPIVQECGYDLAAAVGFRPIASADSAFSVPRFFVARDDVETLAEKVLGKWDVIGWWQDHAPVRVQRLVSPADFAH